MSDVPITSFLSGGVDSSLLSSTASKKIKDLNLLTMDFGGIYSEFEWVSLNKKYGNITKINVDLNSLDPSVCSDTDNDGCDDCSQTASDNFDATDVNPQVDNDCI